MSGDTHGGDRIDFRNGTFRGEAIGKKVEHHHHYGPMPHVEDALPPAAFEFTGRDEELGSLLTALAPAGAGRAPVPVTAVVGLGGVGKTALAVRAAHTARERGWFPGGALFVDGHGYDESPAGSEQLLEALLRALGVAAAHVPGTLDERAGLYRSVLAERARTSGRVLIVVDNASHPGQVRPLLPGHTAHRVLVTSRDTMPQLGAHVLHLDILGPEVARDVLHGALRTAAPADRRVLDDPGATMRLCELCGGLPLALQIAAALLITDPGKPVAELVSELAGSATLLDHLDDGERGVRAAFDLSYRRLDPEPARLFRFLALAPGSETSDEAITFLCGAGALPRRELNVLIRAHLVAPGSVRGRWTLHDLVRAYALDQVSGQEALQQEGALARARLLAQYQRRAEAADWYLQARVGRAPAAGFSGREEALSWLERERTGLVSAALWAADPAYARAGLGLALRLHGYLSWQRYFDDAVSVFRCAVETAGALRDGLSAGKAWNCLGLALRNNRRIEEAVAAHTRACEIHRERGDRLEEGRTWDMLGISLTEARRFDDAIAAHERARELVHACGDTQAEASAWNNLGRARFKLGRFEESVVALTRAREMFRSVGDRFREATAANNLGRSFRETGRLEEALAAHTTARAVFEELGTRERVATAWNDSGTALSALGRWGEAVDAHLRAVRAYQDLGDRHRQAVAGNDLGVTLRRAGRRDEARDEHLRALRLFRELADPHGEDETLRHLAAVAETERLGEAGNR
ncbi:ATP-binding protein [Streptomyces echinatus]|uniref:Tetratricopeptide (TPR) repeat protein n=1 Tax=Streptomyces echinatus TaxID=67293 RepID=A0A7W9UU93_9ACTN|nr:tetratricopeptide repeat protein [Streptomyces echinatus]MBB5931455.1 tetratricopeptide (TPR) repeat protein [Streptomyces echinatus]